MYMFSRFNAHRERESERARGGLLTLDCQGDGGAGRGVGGRGGHDAGRGFAIPVVNKMEIFEVRFSLDTILSLPLDTEIPVAFGYDTILQFPLGAHCPTYFHNRTRC